MKCLWETDDSRNNFFNQIHHDGESIGNLKREGFLNTCMNSLLVSSYVKAFVVCNAVINKSFGWQREANGKSEEIGHRKLNNNLQTTSFTCMIGFGDCKTVVMKARKTHANANTKQEVIQIRTIIFRRLSFSYVIVFVVWNAVIITPKEW